MITKEYLRSLYINFISNIVNPNYNGHGDCPTHVPVKVMVNGCLLGVIGLSFISSSGKEIVEDSNFDSTDDFHPIFYHITDEGYINILGIDLETVASIEFIEFNE